MSSENSEDIDTLKKEYPDLIDKNFNIILINNIRDALKYFLVDYDSTEIV